jgi:hypothetical protein
MTIFNAFRPCLKPRRIRDHPTLDVCYDPRSAANHHSASKTRITALMVLRYAREPRQSKSATAAWMRSSSGIVRGSRRPKPHSVAIENLLAYFFAVASRCFVPSTPSV